MQSKFSYMEKEYESSQNVINEMEKKYKLLQEQYDNLKFEQDISDSDKDSDNGMEELEIEKKELAGKLDVLKMEHENIINELRNELNITKQKMESGNKEIENMEMKVKEMMEEKNKVKSELELSMEENEELRNEVGRYKEKESEMKEELDGLKVNNKVIDDDGESDVTTPNQSPIKKKVMNESDKLERERLYGSDGSDSSSSSSDNDNDNKVEKKDENIETEAVKKDVIKKEDSFNMFSSAKSVNMDDESE
eukprot:922410_1